MYAQLPIAAIRKSMIRAATIGATLTSFPAGPAGGAGAGELVKEEPGPALWLFVPAGIDVRFTGDELLLSEDNFLVESLDAEQIRIRTAFELK